MPEHLDRWADAAGWEKVINRAGMTFRKLDAADREGLDRLIARDRVDGGAPIDDQTSGRLEHDGAIMVGFDPDRYTALFG